MAYWDDLYIYGNTSQGIYYTTEGMPPNRSFIFEFYTSHHHDAQQHYHFQVIVFESVPGVIQYKYFEMTDRFSSCIIGVDGMMK